MRLSLGFFAAALLLTLFAQPASLSAVQQSPPPAVVGRWDLVVQSAEGDYPSWLEVRHSGYQTLVGQFVGRFGSARPVSLVEFANGQLRFSVPPQWERRNGDLQFEGQLEGDRLTGWTTDDGGKRVRWTASRAPILRRAAEPAWDAPVTLFNGTDLTGWRPLGGPSQWQVVNGVLSNTKSGGNLVTDRKFTDFKLHAEFRYPKGGNSGIYLRGRYEVQIEDSPGPVPASDHLGGVYGFVAPSENVSKGPGEWQTFDITLVGRMVSVALNGKVIICNREIPGITGGALDSDEGAAGPLLLQGDHTAVEFRKIIITPAK